MLVIYSTADRLTILSKLGSVICQYQQVPIEFATTTEELQVLLPAAKAVFSLGANALESLQALGGIPKNRKVTGLRRQVLKLAGGTPLMVSYSPSISELDYGQFVDLQTDTSAVLRLADTGSTAPKYGVYKYIPNLQEVVQAVRTKTEQGETVELAFDTETLGLDRFHPEGYIISLQFSWEVGTGCMVLFKSKVEATEFLLNIENQADLNWLLNCPQISLRGANAKYDTEWVYEQTGITCTNLKFDTTLVGSILDENRSNGLDVHAKIYAPELGGYCVAPETRIWRDDLTWAKAEDLKVGDQLVGFDEHPEPGSRRKMLPSTVLSVQELQLRCYELTTSDGRVITVSDNHAWLTHPGTNGGNLRWVQTEKLKVGTRMKVVCEVVEPLNTYDAGWVAGFLDGEGHVTAPKSGSRFELGWAQLPGLVWDRASKLIGQVAPFYTWDGKSSGVLQAKVATYHALKMLQAFRPVRLLSKLKWVGAALPQEPEAIYLASKVLVGTRKVISIKTSTSTFVAEGLASHNSDEFDQQADKSRMDLEYLKSPEKFLLYSAGDADATLRVAKAEKKLLLEDPALAGFYVNVLHPAGRAFEIVERGGVVVDKHEFDLLEADLIADLHRLIIRGKSIIGGVLAAKHYDPDKNGGINLTKASLINDFMFSPQGLNLKPKMRTEKTNAPVTSMEHLEMFKDNPEAAEFVGLMSEFSSTSKTLGTYIVGFRRDLRSDGRFHPTYFLFAGNKAEGDGGTNCMPAGELVLTNRGYLPVEQVVVGDQVITHTGGQQPVVATVLNGVKPIIKVTLSNGLVVRTTANHQYRIGDGWVEAGNLVPGMQAWAHSGVEQWGAIHDWPDFEVSTWGRVFNKKTKRMVTQYPKGKWGHLKVCLYRNGAQKRGEDRKDFTVHGLVARTFLEVLGGTEVRHLNGVSWDNTVTNLEYGTSKENKADALVHGTMSRRNGTQNVLTEEACAFIRSLPVATRKGGKTNKALSKEFGVCERLIRAVRSGTRWTPKQHTGRAVPFKPVQVVSVEHQAPEFTFGLTVAIDCSHVNGGIVTHNTGRLSVKDPAFQCCKGNVLVYNKEGWTSLQSIVEGYEQGKPFTVLTHTGEWKPVVGVYRNGIKPLLKITTKSGAVLECTDNHPWLTEYGFVQAGKLVAGSKVWRFYETTDGSRGVGNRPVVSHRGLGRGYQGSPQVQVPVRVRDGEGTASIKSNWCEAEQVLWLLQAGQADNAWAQPQRERILDLLVLAAHEEQVSESTRQVLLGLWGQGNIGLRFVERFVRDLSSRYGGETTESHVREIGRKWELLQGQLYMGHGLSSGEKSQELSISDVERGHQTPVRLGFQFGCEALVNSHEITSWVESDSSPYHAFQAHQAGFEQDTIVSIEVVPAEETYDLTIEDSHSFVANGIVVHNTIPKHTFWGKRIRKCYTAPPGMLVLENDYSQGELKVMACLAHEDAMIKAYMNGMDLHVVTSGGVAGLSYEQMMALKKSDKEKYDAIRQLGKAGNFGLIYGMGVDGFIEYARLNYGVALSYEEAEKFRTGFFNTYPMLIQYHKQYKAFAHKHGYVRGPMGRVRHLPLINSQRKDVQAQEERRSINSPVQGTLSDMMIWAIAEQHKMGWFDTTPCFGSIHDAGYYYIPEDNAEFYAKRTVQVMENLPFHKVGWNPQLKFTADAKIGKSMGELSELKF